MLAVNVLKFFVFDHENSQIKIKKITKIKKNSYLPTLPLRESVTMNHTFFFIWPYLQGWVCMSSYPCLGWLLIVHFLVWVMKCAIQAILATLWLLENVVFNGFLAKFLNWIRDVDRKVQPLLYNLFILLLKSFRKSVLAVAKWKMPFLVTSSNLILIVSWSKYCYQLGKFSYSMLDVANDNAIFQFQVSLNDCFPNATYQTEQPHLFFQPILLWFQLSILLGEEITSWSEERLQWICGWGLQWDKSVCAIKCKSTTTHFQDQTTEAAWFPSCNI
jgi:hypothetical protein